jgi:hypothetical protein
MTYNGCGTSQLDGSINTVGCSQQNPLGASLGITSHPSGAYDGYGGIRWHYYTEDCKAKCDTCTDYDPNDCALACYASNGLPWWFNGVDYLSYVGTDCCYDNAPVPCPKVYIDYEENTKPWYCMTNDQYSYCTQDVIGGDPNNGPYATKTECERACSDQSCIDAEGILIKGWCCDDDFMNQMAEDIATGCYEAQPSKTISRPMLLCNNGDGDKAIFDKPADRCYYSRKFTKMYKEEQHYKNKIVACSSDIPNRAYYPLLACIGYIGTDQFQPCFEQTSENWTGSRSDYKFPANADLLATISYTFHPEEIVSEATVELTSVFCNLIITQCPENPG